MQNRKRLISAKYFSLMTPIFRFTVLILLVVGSRAGGGGGGAESDVITLGGLLSPPSQVPHSGDKYDYSFLAVVNVQKSIPL